jgi:hypothetical protein
MLLKVMRCIRIAATKVDELTACLRKALEQYELQRVQSRVRMQPAWEKKSRDGMEFWHGRGGKFAVLNCY